MAEHKGQFKKGNTIGKETRAKKGDKLACKYDPKYCAQLTEFFAEPKSEIVYKKTYYSNGKLKTEEPIVLPPRYPTFERFATIIGVDFSTMRNWYEKYPQFQECYDLAKQSQKDIAITNAITKKYDGNFTKFILSNEHGMTDKSTFEVAQDKPYEVTINVVTKRN